MRNIPNDDAGGLSSLHFRRNINRNLTGSQEILPGTPNLNRPNSYNRNTSYAPSICRSVGGFSTFHQSDNVLPKGSSKDEKRKMTRLVNLPESLDNFVFKRKTENKTTCSLIPKTYM